MSKFDLTSDHFNEIRRDMNEVEMLRDAEVNAIAKQAADKFNIPFLGEQKEAVVFAKIIKRIDRELSKMLPKEYVELIRDVTDGISEEEARAIAGRLTPMVNKLVNIPFLGEKQEGQLIGFVLDLIIRGMVKGRNLEVKPVDTANQP